jgi:amidase
VTVPWTRPATSADAPWISGFLQERWNATTVVVHEEVIEAAALPALIAENHRGLATFRRLGDDAELVTLDAVPAGAGTGTALIEALVTELRAAGCRRLWVTATNDKLSALRFYLRRGFRLIQVRPGAVDDARKLKPSIPEVGEYGIPIHDELDLCRALDLGAASEVPSRSRWSRRPGAPSRRAFLTGLGAASATSVMPWRKVVAQNSTKPIGSGGLEYLTATALLGALTDKRVSAVELVDFAIARIEALDKNINAVVVRDFDRARAAAKEADAALARGERRPLLGLPMTVKEQFNVAGLPTTWGNPKFRDWRPDADALTVQRLKAAGAIVIGKTNVPLRLSDWQSYNEIYGTTNNPWDLSRTPGGSSGGAAAALAAGFVSLELGSDIGGSLRAPAHYCGVFSHKPSLDLVPQRGAGPPDTPPLPVRGDLSVVGPMGRSAADLAIELDVLAGPDEWSEGIGYKLALPPPRHEKLEDFRALLIDTHPLCPTAKSIGAALETLSERLAKLGCRVARESPKLPDLARTTRIYAELLSAFFGVDLPAEDRERVEAAARSLSPEDESLAAYRLRGLTMSHPDWVRASRARGGLRQRWQDLFRDYDVVLCPAMPTPAFPHDHSPQRTRQLDIDGHKMLYNDQIVWASIATLTGFPATTAPIDRTESGLPIGVQIIGGYLEDRTTIAFAGLIERAFGGFTPPPV